MRSNILSRVVTSLILIPVVLAAFMMGGYYLALLLALVSLLACFEASNIISPKCTISQIATLLFWIGFFMPVIFFDYRWLFMAFIVPVLFIFSGIVLFSSAIDQEKLQKLCTTFYWSFYINFALACIYWLVKSTFFEHHTGLSFVALICLATWSNDTFAYFGGRQFGRRPLFKSVSHKKTWEGFFCGGILSLVFVFAFKYVPQLFEIDVLQGLTTKDLLWVALPATLCAPFGDLVESRFKRLYDTKDSSNILPGHGGLLDRIDGLLIVAPWTALYAFIIRPLW